MATKALIQCPNCPSRVREDRLEKHRHKVHGTKTQSSANCSRPVKKPTEQHRTVNTSGNQPIVLESRRGKRTMGTRRCDECGVSETFTWRYSKLGFRTLTTEWGAKDKALRMW